MNLQWAGGLSFFILLMFWAFIVVGLIFIRRIFRMSFAQNKDKHVRALANASLFLMSYSLILIGIKQTVGMDFIVFNTEYSELVFNFGSGVVTVLIGLYSMYFIFSKIKIMEAEREKDEPIE